MTSEPVNVYYLRDRWLQGPIARDKLSSLLDANVVDEKTPVWTPALKDWAIPSHLLKATGETVALPAAPGAAAPEPDTPPEWKGLPSPKNLLALRMAKNQELITQAQAERMLDSLFGPGNRDIDLLASIQDKGWITSSQRSTIEAVIGRETVPKLIAGYEIIEPMGSGGMGTTYLARQTTMDRLVALKVLQPKFNRDEEYIRRFEREARMAARLNHENVATAYEFGEVAGQHFMSMEYVKGDTVAQLIEERGPFPEQDAVDVVVQVCRALQHAHEHQLVHRDVKPANIIVRPGGRVKLIDMGLAKSTAPDSGEVTESGLIVCTPDYASPEQARGAKDIDIRADIYSLGCVFFEMLTGKPPFKGATVLDTVRMHIDDPLPSIARLAPDTNENVRRVIERMTAKKPDDRQQTPSEVIEELASGSRRTVPVAPSSVRPVAEQLEAWKGHDRVEVCLLCTWREYAQLVSLELDHRLEKERVDPEFHGYAQTVFAELVANAFDHGCKDATEGVVTITLELNAAFFSVAVEDPGCGFPAKETLERIKKEPLKRERRRGIMQIASIADVFTFSPKGNQVKAVLYRKAEGAGIFTHERQGIRFVEIKGKGDLALVEQFKRWVEDYNYNQPMRVCLMVRTEWVSSLFVGTIRELSENLLDKGSAFSVWVEHQSCHRIMEKLGVTLVVKAFTSLDEATLALRYASVTSPEPSDAEAASSGTPEGGPATDTKATTSAPRPRRRRRQNGTKRGGLVGWLRRLFGS